MSTKPTEIFLKDYTQPDFWTKSIELCFEILETKTIVTSILSFQKNLNTESRVLFLNGVDLELISIHMNNAEMNSEDYKIEAEGLSFTSAEDAFTLTTVVEIHPYQNLSCEGLYRSGSILCTQNEPEGFRKVTFYQDRPDVMASFVTKIIANKSKYPYLLANGNKIDSGDNLDGTHFCTWEDPHKKPSYLFALVAGDLAVVKDSFTTQSNREVALEIFVDKGNEDKCQHAMDSLKDSMKWDEEVFGLEYDLDIYMIVAVDSFNMGAMENKGLNIFNSAYVLAKKETATDRDFQGIQAVIGHEYFHNWTGNRVTCRDWFQLTLKEGLTVFRDQEFSSDMLSRSVKRIEDVTALRSHQFVEDAGPTSHPIQPKSYIEMNNFYTATVYEKGAEVIRMVHTLLGADNFRKGLDLYFERFDGKAVTTHDFITAMADASGVELDQFQGWYDQNGTPVLDVTTQYDQENKKFSIQITQSAKLNSSKIESLHMPFHISLYSYSGEKLEIAQDGKLELKESITTLEFSDIEEKPVISLNNNFTSPVIVNYDYTNTELYTLMSFAQDDFNRFDACERVYFSLISKLIKDVKEQKELVLDQEFLSAFRELLKDNSLDPSFKAYALDFISLGEYNNSLKSFDLENSDKVIRFILNTIGIEFQNELLDLLNTLHTKDEYKLDHISMGKRALKSVCMKYLMASRTSTAIDAIYNVYLNATNMTDEFNTFSLLVKSENPYREKVRMSFFTKWQRETLVMQKWLSAQVVASDTSIEVMKELESSPVFDEQVPNLLRSLVGTFGSYNLLNLNKADGSGYAYFADKIIAVDKFNPQIAAGLAKRLSHVSKLDDTRKALLKKELNRILQTEGLSNDTLEIVELNLG